ncbi:hypothetical protein GXW82_13180 [Streptacidiphilus sp. 4-A2]|nr:hypothetical protein [Streptacidiphilus sp. 4-A2]
MTPAAGGRQARPPGTPSCWSRALITHARLRPRVVLKQALRLDPCLDVLLGGSRTASWRPTPTAPHRRSDRRTGRRPGRGRSPGHLPEGGNFTERRRQRAIRWLRRHGRPARQHGPRA